METFWTTRECFVSLVDIAPCAIILYDAAGIALSANRGAERLTGLKKEEIIGRRWDDPRLLLTGEDGAPLPRSEHPVNLALESDEPIYGLECGFTSPEGKRLYLSVNAVCLRDQEGKPLGVALTLEDRTEAHKREQRLAEERRRAELFLDAAGTFMVGLNREGEVNLINQRGCEILGLPKEEILGKNWFDNFIPESRRDRVLKVFQGLMGGKEADYRIYENPVLTGSGEERLIAWTNSVLRDEEGRIAGTLSSGLDITEKKALEAKLTQTSKMEAIGRLAGGVAHDFNNLLTVIISACEMLNQKLSPYDPNLEYVGEIEEASRRASSLARELLAFGRKQMLAPEIINLNDLVIEMERLLRRIIGEDIELFTELASELWPVEADPVQVEQVIMNLAVNARDAMPSGGKLTIETANMKLDRIYAQAHPGVVPGDYVMLAVSDTGHGMNEDTLERIFEPFFSTKGPGKGTGMGLSVVHGVVRQHGGHIYAYSEPGQGATFKVYLPRAGKAEARAPEKPRAELAKKGEELGPLTILVVEDDPAVRRMVARILRNSGFAILEAGTGQEALKVQAEFEEPIHLLLTDVVMPGGMSGKALAEEIKKRRPRIKVLYMSGYTDNAIANHGVLERGVHFIQKPFTYEMLMKKIKETLEDQ